jgi:hypothetical protein
MKNLTELKEELADKQILLEQLRHEQSTPWIAMRLRSVRTRIAWLKKQLKPNGD